MKYTLTFFLIIFINLFSFSQIKFEKGYFITNSDEKVECLIRNVDLKFNPDGFTYKLTETSENKKETINSVKEFGVYDRFKYSRHTVDIDYSSSRNEDLNRNYLPDFKEETLFLQVLIEGKANLYSYINAEVSRYFFSTEDKNVEQLVYKEFLNESDKITKNNQYKQQLINNLQCSSIGMGTIKNLHYRKSDLVKFFEKYNKCNNETFTNFENKEKKDLFNLNARLGVNQTSLSINGYSITSYIDFGEQTTFRLGVEAEMIMPFHKNKWAIIIEPTYHYFKTDTDVTAYFVTQKVEVDYTSIELPIGIRHYFFLNKNSKIFINASLVVDLFSDGSVIEYENRSNLDIKSSSNLGFGIGYKLLDKFSIECRLHTRRNVLTYYNDWTSDYNSMSLILGYTLF
ncbi:tRNA modification GTPase [Winogradskyella sp. SYSU M77433]|uniref:tRNA modification GTPase n=1 Tax=Winogradskyella sp. SYSU M77433 TaxID=3042722 RepID=UPI0024813AB6|nr:tRNA modification GTPase [Winogradskyella sp. SYSU M77433]MDH7912651.1 tRNA modification GTPase [Winogradskyella sp. SYSU M77433]